MGRCNGPCAPALRYGASRTRRNVPSSLERRNAVVARRVEDRRILVLAVPVLTEAPAWVQQRIG